MSENVRTAMRKSCALISTAATAALNSAILDDEGGPAERRVPPDSMRQNQE